MRNPPVVVLRYGYLEVVEDNVLLVKKLGVYGNENMAENTDANPLISSSNTWMEN